MLARNPKTGGNIRIINLDTSVWRDQKTIVWFDAPKEGSWDRWDIGVTDTNVADSLAAAGLKADVVVCLNEGAADWLKAGKWSEARLVVVPKALVVAMGMDTLLQLRMTNLLCLDEMSGLYPFTGPSWDGTKEDAKALVALALHFGRSFPVEPSVERRAIAVKRGLKLQTELVQPKKLWLVTQYYQPDKQARRKEIDACLQKNLGCDLIDRVVLLNEKALAPKHPKILEKVVGKRLTYATVIRWIAEEAPADAIVVFANADIFLDGTSWRSIWSTDLDTQPKFLALLRWDIAALDAEPKLFGPRPDSQDTWVVSAAAVKAVAWDWDALNFPFGQGGCDNAITLEMFKKRFIVANPALTLRTFHYHASEVRTYDPRNIVDKPTYLYIQPTGLHDMRPVMNLGPAAKTLEFKPFNRPVKGPLSQAQARTFCEMVKRSSQEKIVLDAAGPNRWAPPPVSLYNMNDVFQTREGLVYTYDTILVGDTKASAEAWSESQLSSMAASLSIENAAVAPLPHAVAKDPARFILQYMSKVFLMQCEENSLREVPNLSDFWCPKNKAAIEAIKMFKWPAKEIPVLSLEENLQTWCKSATVWPYQDTPPELISAEEVGALRSALNGWQSAAEKRLVIVMDDKWMTDEMAEQLEIGGLTVKTIWPGKTSLDICIQALAGAWGVVMATREMAAWAWVLPKDAYVWEIQSEMEPSAALLHLSAAAGLDHRLVIVAKGTPNQREKDTVREKILGEMKKFLGISVPKLIMPAAQEGFYGHAGDSFRETARIWAKRGYVELVEKPVCQVWLGGVGETLLYDRPTLQWLQQAPEAERKWKQALFGNPAPSGGKAWSFWPRRPELVEELVAAGLPTTSWETREKNLVFYGRSENAVQRERRTGADWATACDEFAHRISSVDKYTYTQKEYLERLANAKYGLCLAGYGYKCHREIECMAMGCVPVVAPEVDMTNYAEPPVEGLHYFRAATPEEAKQVTAATAERWMVMSAACRDWWKRNASADGMWELTNRLHLGPAAP
jgi:hypothetical protein